MARQARTRCPCGAAIGPTVGCKSMRMCLECHRKYCREQIAERRRRARWAGRLTVEAETHDDLHRWEARRLAQVKRDHARIAAITDEYRPAGGGR